MLQKVPVPFCLQKQITYGKHIAEQFDEFDPNEVYNAFIMPFDANGGETLKFVSVGTADWEKYNSDTKNYAYVLGILFDTKYLLSEYVKHNHAEIECLAKTIETSLAYYRSLTE